MTIPSGSYRFGCLSRPRGQGKGADEGRRAGAIGEGPEVPSGLSMSPMPYSQLGFTPIPAVAADPMLRRHPSLIHKKMDHSSRRTFLKFAGAAAAVPALPAVAATAPAKG